MKRSFQIKMPKIETFDKTVAVNQALDVFHDKGYNATSMQDLVDATGLNRSSIYNTFGCKLDLFLECLKTYQDKYIVKNQAVVNKSNNSLEAIQYIFSMYLNEAIDPHIKKGCFIANCKSEMANQDQSITSFLLVNQEKTIQFIEDIIKQGQEQSVFNTNQSSKDYALYLFSAIQGFRMTSILISDKKQLQSIINTITQTLI